MSAPISHIVFTEKVFDKYFSKFDHKNFILGTSFPDIRYLADLKRNLTHFENVKIQEILNAPNSFEAGVLFHSFVDEKRIEYINNNIKFKKSDITPITVFAIMG